MFRLRVRPRLEGSAKGGAENPLVRYGLVAQGLDAAPMGVMEDEHVTILRLPGGELHVERETGSCELRTMDGSTLLACKMPWPGAQGGFCWRASFGPAERIFGLGDTTRECIEKTGCRTPVWVSNVKSYVPIPWVMSTGGWGVFVNISWRHIIDCGASAGGELRVESAAAPFDVFLVAAEVGANDGGGGGFRSLLDQFTLLTGRPCLLPKWAYGLTFVCNSQADAREMLNDCQALRREGIPCDLVGLEPGWMSEHYDYSVDKKWHPERFLYPSWLGSGERNPNTFLGAAHRLGFKVSLWLCCDYDVTWEAERQARSTDNAPSAFLATEADGFHPDDFEQDEHFGHGPIFSDKLTKRDEPWFDHLKKFVDQGVSAFKLDGALQVNEHPDRLYGNGMRDEEAHNLYPSLLNKQMALGFREHTGRRAMIYSSGGYIGIQRFSATWAGDTGGGHKPLVSMLNHAFCGHANVSCDMDVFTPEGIHFGFLQPWSQLNSWAYWRHPWLLGEKLGALFLEYSRLRYRLIPYLYTAAHEAARTGWPILRPMSLAHPDAAESAACLHQYYLGGDLLVAAFTDRVWLPPLPNGAKWIDYWTGAVHAADGGWHTIRVPAGRGGPLLVRSGAMLPQAPGRSFVSMEPKDNEIVIWEIFPPALGAVKAHARLIEDDGESLAHESGAIAVTEASCAWECTADGCAELRVTISARRGRYEGMPSTRTHELRVHLPECPRGVERDGQALAFDFDQNLRLLDIPHAFAAEQNQTVRITMKTGWV